jgi:hypothetical protein
MDTLSVFVKDIPTYMTDIQTSNPTKYAVLRFLLRFMIYMSAFENVVEDAVFITMPNGDKQHRKIGTNRIKNASLNGDMSFHFRNLRHWRWYTKKINSPAASCLA